MIPLTSQRAPKRTLKNQKRGTGELSGPPLSDLIDFSTAQRAQKHCILQVF